MKRLTYIATLVCVFWICTVNAQLDPLLITPGTGSSGDVDFENSRYTIKNKNTPAQLEPTPSPTPPVQTEKKIIKQKKEDGPVIPSPLQPVVLPEPKKDLDSDIFVSPNLDITKNILEIKTEGFYLYNESKSPYGYRQYYTNSQGVGVTGTFWLQPSWGFESSYFTTVNGTTTGTTDNSTIKSPEQWVAFSITARKVLSSSLVTPILTGKIGYTSYQKKMTANTGQRANLSSTGPFLEFEASLPSSQFYDWILGLEYKPFQNLVESSTGTDLSSGDNPTTNGLGFIFGGKIKLDRKNQVYWHTKLYFEKSIYNNNSKQVDPQTGGAITNAPVQNTFLFFTLGFVWGG